MRSAVVFGFALGSGWNCSHDTDIPCGRTDGKTGPRLAQIERLSPRSPASGSEGENVFVFGIQHRTHATAGGCAGPVRYCSPEALAAGYSSDCVLFDCVQLSRSAVESTAGIRFCRVVHTDGGIRKG